MADTGTGHYYLQLHHSVEGDARIASLPPSLRDLFTRMRLMALQGETPGEINLTWIALLRCLGVRSEKRQARVTHELVEERRLLSRGNKDGDEFILIARWTMPQLTPRPARDAGREADTPRRSYPSDSPEARRRARQGERESDQQPALTESFFQAPNALTDSATSVAETIAESAAESRPTPQNKAEFPIEKNRRTIANNSSKADSTSVSTTPQAVLNEEQIVVVASLVSEGMHPPTAEGLVKQLTKAGKPLTLIEQEIAALDSRNVRESRVGLLRRAIEAQLAGHPYQPPHRHKPSASGRRKITPLRPLEKGEAPDMAMLRAQMKPAGAAAGAP